ncbi:MAG: serine/threonine-protein kinase, partial [Acidobacteriota bacterium]
MSDHELGNLGHYRLIRRLDKGGMSTVYQAEDPRLSRMVALKTLPELWSRDEEQLRRFRREAKTLASLNHPGIVTIYSVEEADGQLFLTMEWVDGEPLSEHLRDGGLEMGTFFHYALQIADALGAAHRRDVVHRDVKPGNIMVTDGGHIKVLDFGLAKRRRPRDEELADSMTLTREGQMVGTLPYMSPEQLQGGVIDHRTDLFSLGIVLFE